MHADFIRPSDDRWNAALSAIQYDVYDIPEYVAVCGTYEDAEPVAFYANEGAQYALIPLLRRPLPSLSATPQSYSDVTSPYGYSSALFAGGPEWPLRAVRQFVKACAERNIISAFVRLHPLLASPDALDHVGVRVSHGETVQVDLTAPVESLRNQQRSGHKYDIRRLRSRGFKAVMDDWSLYESFIQIYWQTMRRLDADRYYLFSADYFRDLRHALGSHLHLFSVLAPDNSVAAAGLFTETQGIVEYHLSGTADEYRRLAPTKLMLDHVIVWAKAAGNRVLHLGGGVGSRDDALFQFKTGFSDLCAPFQTWRVICNQKSYDQLTKDVGIFDASADGFFPAYRKPVNLPVVR